MKILWFTWKDLKNPLAGGAEVVNEEIAKRLAENGHEVILLTAGFAGSKQQEEINGYKVIRVGSRWSIYWHAYKYYKKNLKGWADCIIEEINTIPFFTSFYTKEKKILLFYQLCREIWFHQMFFPLSLFGYLIEPIYLRLLRKHRVMTISESSRKDLARHGFKPKNIKIFPIGITLEPIENERIVKKYPTFTALSLGAIRPMKGTADQIKAFELAKEDLPELKLKIAGGGSGKYYDKVMKLISKSKYSADIEYLGKVSDSEKINLMKKSHLILVTSIKEGWGLIVTEANSQGTPAIVYNVDGLRDSVINKTTGIVVGENTPAYLAKAIRSLIKDKTKYKKFQSNALAYSKKLNYDNSYKKFIDIVEVS